MKGTRDDMHTFGAAKALADILQRLADAEGQTYLLLTAIDPRQSYRFGQPYGVPEDQASEFERTNAARVIRPGGAPPEKGP